METKVISLHTEMIGRSTNGSTVLNLYPIRPTVDRTKADYAFWDRLRRGKAKGFELGALFAEPIAQIMASWALGSGFTVSDGENDATNEALAEFISDTLQLLMQWDKDSKSLGDSYLVVNPDGTLTLVSPDQVLTETDPLDYRKVIAYTIVSQIDQPLKLVDVASGQVTQSQLVWGVTGETVTIHDRYTTTERTVTIKHANKADEVTRYPNLIGRIPIIHLPCEPAANETNGHPIYESLRFLFARYDAVLNKALDGVEIMGNPIPVAEGLEDPDESKRLNSTTTRDVTYADGTTDTESVVDFSNLEMFWLGKGANFKFAAPGSFTADTMNMLQILFLLMLQNRQIPEGVWGGAITGSRASLDAQMPSFVRTVEGWQKDLAPFITALCEVWLAYKSLVDPAIRQQGKLTVEFPPVLAEDDEIMLKKIELANGNGWIQAETGLRLLDMVDDPAAEVEAGAKEAEEKQQRFEDQMQADIERQAALNDDDEPEAVVANA
jgi:hypothetical protein